MRMRSIIFGLTAAFVSPAIAQNNNDNTDNAQPPPTASPSTTDASPTTNAPSTTDAPSTIDAPSTTDAASTTDAPPPLTTATVEQTTSLPDINQATPTTASSDTTLAPPPVPAITSDPGNLPSLPPLPSTALSTSFSFPPPTVPPTNNAPFMQKSNLPDGTVFIAVGAILGAFAVAILVWRAVVAYLLHRSVQRATLAQQVANDQKSYPPPAAPFYKYSDHASSVSLGNAPAPRTSRKARGPVPSVLSQSNLFFSPTAPTGGAGAGNRESRFLPAGFYTSGAASPQQQPQGPSISLTNLRPESYAHPRTVEPSPPESPSLAPPADAGRRNLSSSTINLNRPPSGRAPSAYLEDLLGDQSEQLPPPINRNNWNQHQNRF
ncbi:hypothetical protein GGR50DRAFT_691414 [Xylaria sp. CBS 124048]|nr:hypothetical protein GGR50DRAFT_691414 [Xylaria sp. CBS 124048]